MRYPRRVSEEQCVNCGTTRTGSFRFCRECGFDFERDIVRGAPVPAAAPGHVEPYGIGGSVPTACPYLGLVDDPRTHYMFAVSAHRCHTRTKPEKIDAPHQESFCLSDAFRKCPRYPALDPESAINVSVVSSREGAA